MTEFNYQSIKNRIKQGLADEVSRVEGTFSMDNTQAVSGELARLYSMEIATIPERYSLDTALGKWLDKKSIDFAENRKQPQAAIGVVTFSGTSGTKIPENTEVMSGSLSFITTAAAVIPKNGSVDVAVKCKTVGLVGNIAPLEINRVSNNSSVSGVSVKNSEPMQGGVDLEDDEAFRARILEKIRKPITSGNANHYIYWAKQVAGIGAARCIPCHAGAGTVKVVVLSDEYTAPDEDVMRDVSAHIEASRPIGADVTVVSAQAVSVAMAFNLITSEGTDAANLKNEIETLLKAYLNDLNRTNTSYLSYHKLSDIIFNIDGVVDITSYTINSDIVPVKITIEQYFTLGEVIVSAT